MQIEPHNHGQNDLQKSDFSRRLFLVSSALFVAGCGTKKITSSLPSPVWDYKAKLEEAPVVAPVPVKQVNISAIARSSWAKGNPIPRNMNQMLPVRYITVHHDGMTAFKSTSRGAASSRLETIRKSHLRRDGGRWGDIGYHFAIDPAGRIWEARPLSWQGAHVRAKNEGNIGVVMLGNYELQSVNRAQLSTLQSTLKELMKKYRVPVARVKTHQEWAATACPGESLQGAMKQMRRSSL